MKTIIDYNEFLLEDERVSDNKVDLRNEKWAFSASPIWPDSREEVLRRAKIMDIPISNIHSDSSVDIEPLTYININYEEFYNGIIPNWLPFKIRSADRCMFFINSDSDITKGPVGLKSLVGMPEKISTLSLYSQRNLESLEHIPKEISGLILDDLIMEKVDHFPEVLGDTMISDCHFVIKEGTRIFSKVKKFIGEKIIISNITIPDAIDNVSNIPLTESNQTLDLITANRLLSFENLSFLPKYKIDIGKVKIEECKGIPLTILDRVTSQASDYYVLATLIPKHISEELGVPLNKITDLVEIARGEDSLRNKILQLTYTYIKKYYGNRNLFSSFALKEMEEIYKTDLTEREENRIRAIIGALEWGGI